MTTIPITALDLVLAALLLVINGWISVRLDLGLERTLAVAALRMVVQLLLVALVLRLLFETVSPALTALAAAVMVGFAGYEAMARQDHRLAGAWSYGLGTSAMLFAGVIVTVIALATALRPDPWFHPRYAIPLLGMVLGNTMTGVALAMERLVDALRRDRLAVESMLALGYTRSEAFRPATRSAVRAALIPVINTMAATGLVFLPGMMTGQILAGADPVLAVKYQMLVIFLIAGGTGLGVIIAVKGVAARLSDPRHRLRLDRLAPAGRRGG